MPFNKETASAAGKKSKRWSDKKPNTVRNTQLKINVSGEERDFILFKATMSGLSMTELILKAVKSYKA